MPAGRQSLVANFVKSLIAVLGGNAVYFLILEPRLPAHAQHQLFQFDLGLVIDAWVCLICYGLIELLLRWKRTKPGS